MRTMTHQQDKEYTLALGRINNEHLYARTRGPTLYVLTDVPPGILGYAMLDPRPVRWSTQRTIDDYLNPGDRQLQHDDRRGSLPERKDLRTAAYQSEQMKTEADHASQE
jgi:hypothetical protein